MATVAEQLTATLDAFIENGPETAKKPILESRAEIITTFDKFVVPKAGDKLVDFTLINASGKAVTRDELLASGALLITFYRGNWCPFCNIALHGLQQHLAEFTAKGVQLVAVSPDLPDNSLTTKEKNELEFEVLSDVDNKFSKELGIIWKMPGYLKPFFDSFGTDMEKRHGNVEFEVPLPTNLLVDKTGIIRNVYINPDYTQRLEPTTAVEWANAL
ncbi:hypothetical protein G7046_g6153 [Stylonectria norvegica]|nr:hypothetical protein G7046_g6153 [Stylonectria norvegica]